MNLNYPTKLLACGLLVATTFPALADELTIEGDLRVEGILNVDGAFAPGSPFGLKVSGDVGVVFEGAFGEGTLPSDGVGSRFMWHPGKSALRAGRVYDPWTNSSVGDYSTAFGHNNIASGNSSFASGVWTQATGDSSTAMGRGTLASAQDTVAMGYQTLASSDASVALGSMTVASGYMATASGFKSVASGGHGSTAFGHTSVASGNTSSAMGFYAVAAGGASAAFGNTTSAIGFASTSLGDSTIAQSRATLAIGQFNAAGGHPVNWIEEDPLFEVGNGTGDPLDPPEVQFRNAFTIYKNGDVEMTANVTMPRQGDILMGQFGNEE